MNHISSHTDLNQVVLVDQEEIKNQKKLEEILKHSPDHTKMVEIKISKTCSIYRKKGCDIEQVRKHFIKTHKNSII